MSRFLRQHAMGVTAVATGLAALLLYWPILNLPLSFDDLLHIRFVKGLDYLSVWLPIEGFGFYRPVLFLPILLTRTLFGYYPSSFVYGLDLALHCLNAALVVLLVFRLWQRWPRALAAGLLFAAYPFAWQAVAVFGHNIHLILVFLLLLLLHTYLLALNGQRIWWWVTAVLFAIGLFSHELMVLFGVFAALTQWASQNKLPIVNYKLPITNGRALIAQSPYLVFLLVGGLYILIYQFLPTGDPPPPSGGNLLVPKALYYLQAVTYPLAGWGNQLLPLPTNPLVIGAFLLLAGLSMWAARKKENRLALLMGWGWWGVSSLLLLLTLPTDYVLRGPRLTYLGSIGTSLIWAILLDEIYAWRLLGRVAWGVLLASIFLFSAFFVRGRLAALSNIGSPVAEIQAVMLERPLAEGVLLVNFPSFMSPRQTTFPVGVEHVALMGAHLFAEEIVWENLNQVRPVLAVGIPELLSDPGYPYGTHVQSEWPAALEDWSPAGGHVFITEYTETGVQPIYTGRFGPVENEQSPLAFWGDYTLTAATAVFCAGHLSTELTWELNGHPGPTTSLFVQALASDGRVIGQQDGPPLKIRPDLLPLPGNWQITDHRQITIEPDGQPAQLLIGVYDYQTGERFSAQDANNRPLADNAYSLPIQGCPSS